MGVRVQDYGNEPRNGDANCDSTAKRREKMHNASHPRVAPQAPQIVGRYFSRIGRKVFIERGQSKLLVYFGRVVVWGGNNDGFGRNYAG